MRNIFFTFIVLLLLCGSYFGQIDQSVYDSLVAKINNSQAKDKVDNYGSLTWYLRNKDPFKGIDSSKKALELARSIEYKKGEAVHLNIIGVIHSFLGHFEQSMDYHRKSLMIREMIQDTLGLGSSYNNIGNVYEKLEMFEKAKEYYEKALKIKKKLGNKGPIAISLLNLGYVLRRLNQTEEASKVFSEALKISDSIDNKNVMALSLSNKSLIYLDKGNYLEALKFNNRALKLRKDLGNKIGVAIQSNITARIYARLRNFRKSFFYLNQAKKVAIEEDLTPILKECYETHYKVYKEKGDYPKALKFHEMYSDLKDSLLNKRNRQRILISEAKYENEKSKRLLKALDLEKQKNFKNFLLIMVFVSIMIIIGFIYNNRSKSKFIKEIKERKELNAALLDNLPEYVLIRQGDEIVYLNDQAKQIVKNGGFDKNSLPTFIHEEDRQLVEKNVKKRLNGEKIKDYEIRLLTIDGEIRNVIVRGKAISYKGNPAILIVLVDITKMKNIQKELIDAKDKAEHSEKLKSEFLAQMSHEIRTPLNTIFNYSSLIKAECYDLVSDDLKDSFSSIDNAINRLLRTIDLILNMSDIESGTYDPYIERIDLKKDIVMPVISEFKSAAELKNINLVLSNNHRVMANLDRYTTTQIVVNLVDNAIKYTNEGEIKIGIYEDDGIDVLSIKDTGIGISENYLPKLFSKFTQEEQGYTRKFEGSGLGLALVKEYCNINNIEIKVESTKGIGTEFKLYMNN